MQSLDASLSTLFQSVQSILLSEHCRHCPKCPNLLEKTCYSGAGNASLSPIKFFRRPEDRIFLYPAIIVQLLYLSVRFSIHLVWILKPTKSVQYRRDGTQKLAFEDF